MKKNIDSYFKEKLNQSQSPPTEAWEHISAALPKKRKRRIYPIVWKSAAVAALLIGIWGTGYWVGHKTAQNEVGNTVSSGVSTEVNAPLSPDSETVQKNSISSVSATEVENEYGVSNENVSVSSAQTVFTDLRQSQHVPSADYALLDQHHSTFEVTDTGSELQLFGPGWGIINSSAAKPEFSDTPDLNSLLNSMESESGLWAFQAPEQNPFEKSLKEKTKKTKKKAEFDRFHVSGFISPMSLNSFVGSSMLSDAMRDYKTENSIILAYGMKGGYSLSPSVKLRTGLSMVGFEQITKNVPIASTAKNMPSSASVMNNVHYKGALRIDHANKNGAAGMDGNMNTGDIRQQSQYLEIPLEAEVALIQTGSIGISATGGASTWLLSKNKIYVHTDGFTEELGRANNLNTTSFSANLGLKFDFNILEDVNINVEPGFKYLINPVNNIEKFNPYTIGVNAGVSVSLK